MKTTKFLPLALSCMLLAPAFAAGATNTQSTELELTLTPFVNVVDNSTVKEASATYSDTYDEITLSANINPNYTIYNNKKGRVVQLSAIAHEGSTEVAALGGTVTAANSPIEIAFTNGEKAESGAVSNALGSAAAKSNGNVIVFTLTPTITAVADTGATAPTGVGIASGVVSYTISNGEYTFDYNMSKTAKEGTFSTHDENGTYTSTLTLTAVES